jgi:GTPase SAR1 family protein
MFTSYASDFIERYKERKKERERVSVKMSVKQRKVALMGFRSVGKSSLAIQFVQVFP